MTTKETGPSAQAREIIEEHEAKFGPIHGWWELKDNIAAAIAWAEFKATPSRNDPAALHRADRDQTRC